MDRADPDSLFPTTPVTLLGRLRESRDDDWREFSALYGPVIYRMARAVRLGEHDAQDVVAVVMRRFVQRFQSGFQRRPGPATFRRYLRTVANREIKRAAREHARLESAADGSGLDGLRLDASAQVPAVSSDEWTQLEREEYLAICMERLRASSTVRPRDYQAFVCYVLRDEPARTVARRFGLTEDGLYQIKHRLLDQLRRIHAVLNAAPTRGRRP